MREKITKRFHVEDYLERSSVCPLDNNYVCSTAASVGAVTWKVAQSFNPES